MKTRDCLEEARKHINRGELNILSATTDRLLYDWVFKHKDTIPEARILWKNRTKKIYKKSKYALAREVAIQDMKKDRKIRGSLEIEQAVVLSSDGIETVICEELFPITEGFTLSPVELVKSYLLYQELLTNN